MPANDRPLRFPHLMQKYLPLWVTISISLDLFSGYQSPTGVKELKPAIPFLLFVMLYPMMINLLPEPFSTGGKPGGGF